MLQSHLLLLVKLDNLGAIRQYRAFIPVDAPKVNIALTGSLIDINTSHILWRYTVHYKESVKGHWDKPPHYKNFSKAYAVAVKKATQLLMDNFFDKRYSKKHKRR